MIVHSHQSAMNYRGHNEVWHVAEFLSKKTNRPDIARWCYRSFGPAGYQAMTDEIRWQDSIQYGKIVFSREQDLAWFLLRWSA
jgi:hypothetical protein